MGSESKNKLPFIDFSGKETIIPASEAWNSTRVQVLDALQEYGCFQAYYTGVPLNVRESMFNSLQQLFDLPLETKMKNVEERPFSGYVGPSPRVPLYESSGIIDTLKPGKTNSFTNLMWPQGNPEFSETMQTYSKKLSEFGEVVRRMVLESLGLEKYVDEHLESTSEMIRFIKYKAPETKNALAGLVAHKDTYLLTILHANAGGLEVQIKGTEEWVQVEAASPHSFIIMAGECYEAYTNGRIHPPVHKVVMSGNEARFSIGYFTDMKADHILETPKEMVDEEHPLLYKPFNNDDYLRYYMKLRTIEGREGARKAYCGV